MFYYHEYGFTRELIVGLIANLESREIRRQEYLKRVLPPEHLRASSSDDVEGFVALLHDMFGLIFDLNEFGKRIDPNLPFYYWTDAKEHYRDFALPSFNDPTGPGDVERLDRIKVVLFSYNRIYRDQTLSARITRGMFVASYNKIFHIQS